jgi:hypothetical protein
MPSNGTLERLVGEVRYGVRARASTGDGVDDGGDPASSRAGARRERRERLTELREHRCKRFHVVEPLAHPPASLRETLLKRRQPPSELRETLSKCRERLQVFREHRCKRFHVVEPLASLPSSFRGTLSAPPGRLSA